MESMYHFILYYKGTGEKIVIQNINKYGYLFNKI